MVRLCFSSEPDMLAAARNSPPTWEMLNLATSNVAWST